MRIPLNFDLKPSVAISFILGLATLHASPVDDINLLMHAKKMSIYELKTTDKNVTNGFGIFYNTQNLKIKAERSDCALKTGAVVQTNPFKTPMYISVGGNYLNEEVIGNDLHSSKFDQLSGAMAIGYSLQNDLYIEAGKNVSKLDGSQPSENTGINNSLSKETFAQLGKRFEMPIGTVDTQMKGSQIYQTLSAKVENYEGSVHYYLNDVIKLGYIHNINQNDISNGYSIDIGYFSTQYTKDITQDAYNITLGLKADFTDITDFSSYKSTTKVKKNLSKSKKLDNIILQKNMKLRR